MLLDSSRTESTATLDAAREYIRRGLAILPIPRGQKGPHTPNWPNLRLTEPDLAKNFSTNQNIGVILGTASGGITDVDLDSPQAISLAKSFLPNTEFVFGRASKPRSHYFYFCAPLPLPRKYCDIDGSCIVELRSDGQQTVVPPSLHPSGELYVFQQGDEPARATGKEIAWRVACLASASILAHHWPQRGQRNDAANALAGMLLRAGWNEEQTSKFIEAVTTAAGDEEVRARIRDVASTLKRLVAGRLATGAPTLSQVVGEEVVGRASEWLCISKGIENPPPPSSPQGVTWPEPLAPEAFHGVAGEFVHGVENETEADPAALLIQFLVCVGSILGPSLSTQVSATIHHANLFALIVGESARARKGTSLDLVKRAAEVADPGWSGGNIAGGLSTGEGLISKIQDETWDRNKRGERVLVQEGVLDKRLLAVETEFSSALRVMQRDGNTLSPVLRQAWDSTTLRILTRNSPATATLPHVSIIGHITVGDLLANLSSCDQANGLANRFLIVCARRARMLPEGGRLPVELFIHVGGAIKKAREFVEHRGHMLRDSGARHLWAEVYGSLTEGSPDLLGGVTARAEAQTLRLSLLYAALDRSPDIKKAHLLAALAVWDYCRDSARYIFGTRIGDLVADRLDAELSRRGKMTREEMSDLFGRNLRAERIECALQLLERFGRARRMKEETRGRPAEVWIHCARGTRETAEALACLV